MSGLVIIGYYDYCITYLEYIKYVNIKCLFNNQYS